jgi:hypothetical protein
VPTHAQCLKFETDQAQDVKRLEKLNSLFFSYMCGKDPHADTELDGELTPTQRTVRTLKRLTVLALTWLAPTDGKSQPRPATTPPRLPTPARPPNANAARLATPKDDSTHARTYTLTHTGPASQIIWGAQSRPRRAGLARNQIGTGARRPLEPAPAPLLSPLLPLLSPLRAAP